MAGYYDPDGFWVNTDDSGEPTGYIADPLNEQKGFGSGAGTNVVTDPSGVPSGSGFNLSGLTSILGPFKGIFDRLKSGNTTTADVNAALGVLGLLVPSLTAPKTAGWKGSIDLNRQFTRTPTAPITYTPYSGQPVMGRQYFTSAYGAPGAPAPAPATPAPAPAPAAPGTGNPDLDNPSSTGGLAQGGIASLRRFAEGGDTGQRTGPQFYDYHVGANARMVDVPGIEKPVLMFFDIPNNRVVVSDEGYWNPHAPIGEDLNKAVSWARDQGLQAGVVVSPYSWDAFGKDAIGEDTDAGAAHPRSMPGASFDQLKEYMNAADFVVTDPYVVSAQTATPGVQEKLIQITGMIGDHAQETGKPAWLVLGGSEAPKGTDPNLIYNYTDNLLANTANKFNQVSVFEGTRDLQPGAYLPTWDYLQASNILAKNGIQPTGNYGQAFQEQKSIPVAPYVGYDIASIKVGSVQDFLQGVGVPTQGHYQPEVHLGNTQQPAALTGLAGSLPSGWSGYGAEQKIDWFNQNKVTPDQLLGAGVGQGDIDWMKGQGYLGSYDTGMDIGTASLTPQSGFSWTGQGGIGADMYQASAPTMQIEQPTAKPFAQPSGVEQLMPQVQQPVQQPMQQLPSRPQFQMVQEEQVEAAQGGLMSFARGGRAMPPRYLRGQTDGMADRIPSNIDGVQPAKLSHGEFVIPADVVSHLGNGNSDAGAKVLYKMMDRVRQARTGTKKQGRQINPEKFTPGGIAGYAGGGAVAFNAGGTTGTTGTTGTPTAPLGTSTETNISSWAGPYVGDMLSKTSALTNAPYQAWTGPLSAGYSPLQQKTFTGLESLSFPGQLGQSFTGTGAPTLPTASTTGPTQSVGGPTGIAANYMNPYLNAVLQPQLEELRRQSQISEMGSAAKFAQAGGYGGGREAIMRAEGQRNLLGEMNKAIGTGYASAYDKALQQFNTEQGQAKTLAEMMAGAGATQRGIEQEGITEARKQFETEQLKPYTDLRFQKEMLSGLPVATAATTANTSTIGDIRGGLADLQKALAALGVG